MSLKQRPIGVFDSGQGGLSVLRALYQIIPNENYVFYGDSKNAPYGIKSPEEVYQLSKNIVDLLIDKYNVKAIVIACNTATSVAAQQLREEYDIPIIGLEPAIKPAVKTFPDGKIIVMATPLTLSGTKFNHLVNSLHSDAQIIKVPAPQLVKFVERDELDTAEIKDYLHRILDEYLPVDAIVLGCTHFPFAQKAIQEIAGTVSFFDGSWGAARHLKNQLEKNNELIHANDHKGVIEFLNSNPDPREIELSKKLFNMHKLK